VNEGEVNGHSESAEALVIGIMPIVDLSLVDDLVMFVLLLSGLFSGDGISGAIGAKVASDKGHPLLVVGALESGNVAGEGGGGDEHFVKELVLE